MACPVYTGEPSCGKREIGVDSWGLSIQHDVSQ